MRTFRLILLTLPALVFALPALAQAPVGAADLSRLETTAAEIRSQVTTLKQTDATLSADVDRSLTDLTDEIAYLRVKLRREGAVTREEYASVRDRLETLLVRAQGQRVEAQPVAQDLEGAKRVAVGTEFDVRLQTSLTSATAKLEDRFEATTLLDYSDGGSVLIPAGSVVRGFVSSVRAAGKIERQGSITLSFDELRIGSRSYRLRASLVQALDPKMGEDYTRIGAGAAIGAVLGGLLGGGKGALVGVIVGGGGTVAATAGADAALPAGTILRIRLDQSLDILSAR
jgi:hypothetical protein